jgi:large subunit ribosomal protein L27
MAKKKQGSSKAKQGSNVAGKADGIKVFGGMLVKSGQIIVRQRGRKIVPGENVGMGKDFTIFSKIPGVVKFGNVRKNKKKVDVIEQA